MRLTIQWRFVLKLAVLVLLAATSVYFVHRWQVGKQTGAFLRQADLAHEARDHEREALYLRRYVASRPDDLDTRERLGRLLCETARGGRQLADGYLVIEDVLRRDADRDALRRSVIDFAIDPRLGLYREARGHIDALLQKRPADGELEGLRARCLVLEKDYAAAAEWYKKSIEHNRNLIESHGALAVLYRQHLNRPREAGEAIARMLETNPNDFRARLLAATYYRAHGPSDKMEAEIAAARRLAPDELEVLLFAADVEYGHGRTHRREGDAGKAAAAFTEARQILTRGLELHPKATRIYQALANLEAETRSAKDALGVIQRGLAALPTSTDLMRSLLEYQIQTSDIPAATATLEKLRTGGLTRALADYHQARIQVLQEKWADAATALERALPELRDNPALAHRADVLLGRCYEQLGENDRRLAAFSRVAADRTDPDWVQAMIGVAEAQAALGQAEAALDTYRKLAAVAPGASVQIARLELFRALQAPRDKADWRPTEEAVAQAEKAVAAKRIPDPIEVRLLRATLTHYLGKPDDARKQLEQLRTERPKEAAVHIELAMQDLRDGQPARALATVAAAEREVGDTPELRLTRARALVAAKEADLPARLASLGSGTEKFSPTQQRRLLRGLAEIAGAAGAGNTADRLLNDLAQARPYDLSLHTTRFDRAMRAGDEAAMERVIADIRRANGETGPVTRLTRAFFLLWQAQKSKEGGAGLNEAAKLLGELEREQPGSGRVALALAYAHDLRGKPDAALPYYQRAVALGESSLQTLRRMLEILTAKGRDLDAQDVIRRITDPTALAPDAQRLAAEVSLRTARHDQAFAFAALAVPESSKNPRDQLWFGHVCWLAGKPDKALAAFREAIHLDPKNPDSWLLLIQFLVATEKKDEAAKTLEEARSQVNPAELSLFLALAHSQLGDSARASEAFAKARAERPDHLRTAQAEAEFHFRAGRVAQARDAFLQVTRLPTASPDDKESATQMYAICLAADGSYENSRRALEVLGPIGGQASPERWRARVLVLALQSDGTSKAEAIRLLEAKRDSLTPNDEFLLAQLHAATENAKGVRIVMGNLLRRGEPVPLYAAFFARWLLANSTTRPVDIPEAEKWVAYLEKTQSGLSQTAELKARLLAAKKNPREAAKILLALAERPGAQVVRLASVCEEIGLFDEAEQLLQRYAKENEAARPGAVLAVAAFHGRRGNVSGGVRACLEAPRTVPAPAVGEVAVGVLYSTPNPNADDLDKVARWLETQIQSAGGPERAALLQQLASVRNLQGNYDAAIALYGKALEVNRRDVVAMNNLAYLLSAHKRQHDNALQSLADAKAVNGPKPDLLDTEALVRLNRGDTDEARRILRQLVVDAPSGPAYFHLARAELAGKPDSDRDANRAAWTAWQEALNRNLRLTDIHPLEGPAFKAMADRMSRKR